MPCKGPVCKFCDEIYHRKSIMEKEETEWNKGYEHLNRHIGWRCHKCGMTIDYCPQCGKLITDDEYKIIHDPDPQNAGYVCSRCGFEEEI